MRKADTYNSDFIKAGDDGCLNVPGAPRTLTGTVKSITTSTFDDGRAQRVLHFNELEMSFGLNVTNWDMISSSLNQPDDDNWMGASVTIGTCPNPSPMGGKYRCIVTGATSGAAAQSPSTAAAVPQPNDPIAVQHEAPFAQQPPPPAPPLGDNGAAWVGQQLAPKGATVDQLRGHLLGLGVTMDEMDGPLATWPVHHTLITQAVNAMPAPAAAAPAADDTVPF